MRRFKASALLVLTAFFAVADAYHRHGLPLPTHEHHGICSETSSGPSLESCAICRAAQATADSLAVGSAVVALDRPSPLAVTPALVTASVAASLLHDDRAPPAA